MCNNVHMMAYEYITHQKQRLRTAPWPVERSSSSCRAHPAWGRTVIRWYPEFPQVTVVVIPVRDSTWQVTAMVIQKNWPHQPWLCITTHNGWYFTFKWLMGSFVFLDDIWENQNLGFSTSKNQHQNVAVVIAVGHNHRPSHGYRGHHQWVATEAELRRQQRRPDKPTIPYLYLHVQHFCIMQSD